MKKLLYMVIILIPLVIQAQVTGLAGWDICLDPGHSRTENMGIYGYSEAEKNVRVALNLREILLTETDIDTVYVTRFIDDTTVYLSQRTDYANGIGTSWFHSIHSDASTMGSSVNSTLLLWGQYNTGQEKVPNGGKAMSDIMIGYLTDGMRTYTTYGSIGDCSFYGCGDWSGPWLYVNRFTEMPSELSEAGFHTNPRQNTLNMNDDWKRLEARTFFWSILEYHQIERPQVRILTGIVTDLDTGVPVNGAEIQVEGRTYTTDTWESLFYQYTSDPDLLHNGFYYFEDISGDSVQVIASAEGYYSDTVQVAMIDDFFTFKDFRLISSVPPYVSATIPEQNEQEFSIVDDIEIYFSRPMNEASVETTLTIDPSIPLQFEWPYDQNSQLLLVTSDSLKFETDYILTISGQARDLHDHLFDGNSDGIGGDDFVLNFRSGSDYVAPRLSSSYPAFNEKDIPVSTIINLIYDERVDSISVDEENFQLENFAEHTFEPLTLTHQIMNRRSIFSLFPEQELSAATAHYIRVLPGLQDLLGNQISTTTSIPFVTNSTNWDISVIDNFESYDSLIGLHDRWWSPGGSGSTTGILPATDHDPEFSIVNHLTNSDVAMKLHYEWDTDTSAHLIRLYLAGGAPREVIFDASHILQVYMYGDGSGNQFRFCVDEGNASKWTGHEVSEWTTIDWYGWRLIEWDMADPAQVGAWIGNGVLDGTRYRIDSFQFTYAPDAPNVGDVYLDDLRLADPYDVLNITDQTKGLPRQFRLSQNYPNPFNPLTEIQFSIPRPGMVSLKIYTMLGQQVATLVNKNLAAGEYKVNFDGQNLASGTYIYQLVSDKQVLTRRMTLLK